MSYGKKDWLFATNAQNFQNSEDATSVVVSWMPKHILNQQLVLLTSGNDLV
jgi:hypothetical protein